MADTYDVIVVGAGSVGTPCALFLAEEGLSVLVVEGRPSVGQGENKAAIGGIRATHSDAAKIRLCLESLRIVSTWEAERGTDIGWKPGGYCFPVFREREEKILKGILPVQKKAGLEIDWVGADRIRELIPGIAGEGLRGGTHSPGDGQVSPLMAAHGFHGEACRKGVVFRFGESVRAVSRAGEAVKGVETDRGSYHAPVVVNAAGVEASRVAAMAGVSVPVVPDSHEGGITAPVEPFLDPLVVDLRPGPEGRTANFYFGQNHIGAVIFCYTPIQPFLGTDRNATSEFMPVLASRMISLLPRMRNALVRRVWRGCYPMTPDGLPVVGPAPGTPGFWLAVGMCGQG
ncbi:MAG: NAD(P)/FAD-dependent oxidoreductase, partial [Planctomycetota bacterium]